MRFRSIVGRRSLMITSLVAIAGLALPSAQAYDSASETQQVAPSAAVVDASTGAGPSSGQHLESRSAALRAELAPAGHHTDDRIIIVGLKDRSSHDEKSTSRTSIKRAGQSPLLVTLTQTSTGSRSLVTADRIIIVGVTPVDRSNNRELVIADRIIIVGGPRDGKSVSLSDYTVSVDGGVAK